MFDCIVLGAGLAGCVLAERFASDGKRVLLLEKKEHIGGTCYDFYDKSGILVHKYGPHIFNTDSETVWKYVNRFSDFRIYHHRVLGVIEGKKVPVPFNLESLYQLFPSTYAERIETKLLNKYAMNTKVPIMELQNQDDPDLKYLANYIYEYVFLHYTKKQWGMSPEEVGGTATARIPFYISRDDRYFQNRYQGIPVNGYTDMINHIIDNENIHVLLKTDYHKVIEFDQLTHTIKFMGLPYTGKVIVTVPLDELFDFCFGHLPYRTLDFKFETFNTEYFQEICTVNYPNNYDFTRITEFKYMTGQVHPQTTIVKEFPKQYDWKDKSQEPYYPIPQEKNTILYNKYRTLLDEFSNVILSGRLADYKYYTMSETITNALGAFDKYCVHNIK